jgi:hypothetical protein
LRDARFKHELLTYLVDDSPLVIERHGKNLAAMGKDVVMKSIGWLLVILGAGSFVLHLIGREFTYLMWIDNWGEEAGWAIRGVMIVAGGVLIFLGMKSDAGAAVIAEPAQPVEPQEPEPLETEPQGFEPQVSTERE